MHYNFPGKHRYPDVQRPLKYPGHDSESDLQPIRYPDTQPNDAPSNPIRYPHSGEATSDYPSDRSNHHTASRDTSSGSEDDFIKVVKGLLTQRKVGNQYITIGSSSLQGRSRHYNVTIMCVRTVYYQIALWA